MPWKNSALDGSWFLRLVINGKKSWAGRESSVFSRHFLDFANFFLQFFDSLTFLNNLFFQIFKHFIEFFDRIMMFFVSSFLLFYLSLQFDDYLLQFIKIFSIFSGYSFQLLQLFEQKLVLSLELLVLFLLPSILHFKSQFIIYFLNSSRTRVWNSRTNHRRSYQRLSKSTADKRCCISGAESIACLIFRFHFYHRAIFACSFSLSII